MPFLPKIKSRPGTNKGALLKESAIPGPWIHCEDITRYIQSLKIRH